MSPLDRSTRREFMAITSSAALGAAVPLPRVQPEAPVSNPPSVPVSERVPYSSEELFDAGPQRTFSGDNATQIAFPLGGIGAGCICLNGYGGSQDFSVRNRPALTAAPEMDGYSDAAFAVLHMPEKNITRLVEGPFPKGKIYAQGLKPEGILGGGHEGLPRFRKCSFRGEFPFGIVRLSDPLVGLDVEISGFNPFIPLDDKNSSIPCAILEYTFRNQTSETVNFQFTFHL